MSPALPRARRVLTLMCAGLVVLGATAVPASADSVSAYLSRTTPLIGPCGGSYWITQATGLVANPDTWYSLTKFDHTDKGGNIETQVFRRDGVSRYSRNIACSGSSNYRRVDNPTKYVHQFIYQNWLCYGGSCQYLYTNYGSWLPGARH